MEHIAELCPERDNCLITIILDGENAWEHFPENGYYFLNTLYKTLAGHPGLNMTTYSEYLANRPQRQPLRRLVSGSWVYGTFSTWIGDVDKNKGWDMLVDAKHAYDQQIKAKSFTHEELECIEKQLAICEGSDWFWWFGDYNPSDSVTDFDYLYRLQLSNLYMLLGLEPPDYLSESFSHGGGTPAMGGVMRHGHEHT